MRGLSTNDREKAKEGEKARNKQRKIYTYICIKRNITCAKGWGCKPKWISGKRHMAKTKK